jgi:hypothetical protein
MRSNTILFNNRGAFGVVKRLFGRVSKPKPKARLIRSTPKIYFPHLHTEPTPATPGLAIRPPDAR